MTQMKTVGSTHTSNAVPSATVQLPRQMQYARTGGVCIVVRGRCVQCQQRQHLDVELLNGALKSLSSLETHTSQLVRRLSMLSTL